MPRRSDVADCNGKEKDYESGVHLPCRGLEHLNDKYNAVKNYGARYCWSELLTGWLSVDPMMDKYPSITPYNYCVWNPVKLVDPDGKFPAPTHAIMVIKACKKMGGAGTLRIGPINILKMCWGASIVADIFHSRCSQVHLDGYGTNTHPALVSAYKNAIRDYQNAHFDGDFVRAAESLHTIGDFYAHSNYVEQYDRYSESNNLSSNINDIPTFDVGGRGV